MNFNPDYLCNDPNCKSREVVMQLVDEYQQELASAEQRLAEMGGKLGYVKHALESYFRISAIGLQESADAYVAEALAAISQPNQGAEGQAT